MTSFPVRSLIAISVVCLVLGCSGQPEPSAQPATNPSTEPASPAASEDTTGTSDSSLPEDTDNPAVEATVTEPETTPTESESTVETPQPATEPAPAEVSEAGSEPVVPFWPRFHGPNGDNISTDSGLLKEWPEDGPPLVWTAEGIGNGYSSVSMAGGLIYTVGNIKQDADDDESVTTVISALDLDGKPKWEAANGPAWTTDTPGSRSTPTVDGDRLYHQSPLGNLLCLNAENGEPIWGMNILEAFEGTNIKWALSESVLIDGDHVIVTPCGKQASMAALNKATGDVVWTAESVEGGAGYASPVLVEYQGLRILLTMTAKAVIGVDASDGRLLFQDPYETEYDVNALTPIFHEGQVFVSTGYGGTGARMLKLNVEGKEVSVDRVWESEEMDNQHGGVLLLDGYLYGTADRFNNAKLICLQWDTGEIKWAERAVGKGSLTYADGLFYLFSERRRVGLAQATPESFEMISQFSLPSGGTGASWAHPVVCGGRLYLRWDDRLFAYDVQAD